MRDHAGDPESVSGGSDDGDEDAGEQKPSEHGESGSEQLSAGQSASEDVLKPVRCEDLYIINIRI